MEGERFIVVKGLREKIQNYLANNTNLLNPQGGKFGNYFHRGYVITSSKNGVIVYGKNSTARKREFSKLKKLAESTEIN